MGGPPTVEWRVAAGAPVVEWGVRGLRLVEWGVEAGPVVAGERARRWPVAGGRWPVRWRVAGPGAIGGCRGRQGAESAGGAGRPGFAPRGSSGLVLPGPTSPSHPPKGMRLL
ncbi:hypothetical protein GCM10010400_38990 [Streptomyces aculeolatus]